MRNTLLGTLALVGAAVFIASCGDSTSSASDITSPTPIEPPPVASVTVMVNKPVLEVGETTQASVQLRDAADHPLTGRAVTWTSLDTGVVRISSSGVITAVEAGSATITAKSESKSGTERITANGPARAHVAKVEITAARNYLLIGDTTSTTVKITDAKGRAISDASVVYMSENPAVASISAGGLVSALAEGATQISATSGGVTGSESIFVTAMPRSPVPASVTITLASEDVTVGQVTQASAVILDAQGVVLTGFSITWMSSNTAVATVDSSGRVTTVGVGASTISASTSGITGSTSIAVTATPPVVASVVVSISPSSLHVGETAQATAVAYDARLTPIVGIPVSWSVSSGALVVGVSPTGIVTALSEGNATIQAIIEGVSATAHVTVPSVTAVVLSPAAVTLTPGATAQFSVAGSLSDGSSIVPAVVYTATGGVISPTGSYTASTMPGAFRVIATQQGGTKADTSTVTISNPVVTLLALLLGPASVTLTPGSTQQFSVSGNWSDGSSGVPAVTYSATGGTVSTGGLFTAGPQAGTYRVIATQQGGSNSDTSIVSIVVPPPTLTKLTISPKSVALVPNETVQFSITGNWSDGSTMAPAATYVSTGGSVTTSGLYTAGATPGLFRVVATQQGGTRADTAMLTVSLPPAVSLALVVQPSATLSGSVFPQQPVVELRDAQNHPVLKSGVSVTTTLSSGTGILGGPATASTDAQGRATFAGLQIIGTGPQTLSFTASGLTSVTSATLNLVAPTLRSLASARGFSIGAAVRDTAFARDPNYRQTLAQQYNSIVPEDATDFWPIHPGPNQYSFAAADALVNFAQANGMAFHGHHLAWYSWIPTWVTAGGYSQSQLRNILKDHITTVVGRYKGKVASWDVVNEVENDYGTGLRQSFWIDHLGPEYIDSAFVWARRADPVAKLFINDYATETTNPKSTAVLALAEALRARGVPVDGVGFQVHIYQQFSPAPTGAQVQANFQRFADAGFDIRITEMDVDIPDSGGATTLAAQATIYGSVLDACLKVSRCTELTTWGFSDRYSYVPSTYPGYGRALPFDVNYQGKPAFDALISRLRQQ